MHEESIHVVDHMPRSKRSRFLSPFISPSISEAANRGSSLSLLHPIRPKFIIKSKSSQRIEKEREAYKRAASQLTMFDKELAAIEPSPHDFRFQFEDADGRHDFANADWEVHAMYWNGLKRGQSEAETLDWISTTFNEDYPKKGMLFAVGNQAKRPQTWQLLGVLRVDYDTQGTLDL